jgi:hypothetical protein
MRRVILRKPRPAPQEEAAATFIRLLSLGCDGAQAGRHAAGLLAARTAPRIDHTISETAHGLRRQGRPRKY